jgi:hypothetical protein
MTDLIHEAEHAFVSDIVHVHVDNTDEFRNALHTEEVEPEHFVFSTYNIGPAGTQYSDGTPAGYVSVALDLKRKSIAIQNNSAQPIVLCHTISQAHDPANYATPLVNPVGAYIPAGGNAAMDGTGPLQIVNTSTTQNALVTVIVNRRGNA